MLKFKESIKGNLKTWLLQNPFKKFFSFHHSVLVFILKKCLIVPGRQRKRQSQSFSIPNLISIMLFQQDSWSEFFCQSKINLIQNIYRKKYAHWHVFLNIITHAKHTPMGLVWAYPSLLFQVKHALFGKHFKVIKLPISNRMYIKQILYIFVVHII